MDPAAPARPAPAQAANAAASLDAAPPPAAEQLARAFASPGLPQRMTLHLAPAELGAVQIGIERAPDGPARVSLLAERPDTLLLLMRDQPALHRALDAAGLPAEGRTLHFGLAQPGPANAAPAPALAAPGSNGSASMGAGRDGSAPGGSQNGSQGSGAQGSGAQGSGAQGGHGWGGYSSAAAEAGSGRPPARTPAQHRTSVDITA